MFRYVSIRSRTVYPTLLTQILSYKLMIQNQHLNNSGTVWPQFTTHQGPITGKISWHLNQWLTTHFQVSHLIFVPHTIILRYFMVKHSSSPHQEHIVAKINWHRNQWLATHYQISQVTFVYIWISHKIIPQYFTETRHTPIRAHYWQDYQWHT